MNKNQISQKNVGGNLPTIDQQQMFPGQKDFENIVPLLEPKKFENHCSKTKIEFHLLSLILFSRIAFAV